MKLKTNLKITCMLLLFILLSISLKSFTSYSLTIQNNSIHMPQRFFHQTTRNKIHDGITHINQKRFTPQGPLNINILEVDLTNTDLQIDTLANSNSILDTQSIDRLTSQNAALAGINASFFELFSPQYPLGLLVKSNTLVSLDYHFNEYSRSLATFTLDTKNNPDIVFFEKPKMIISNQNDQQIKITQYNKASPYASLGYFKYDNQWSNKTMAKPDTIEIIVSNDTITSISQNDIPVNIPQNGFYIQAPKEKKSFMLENFNIGDKLFFEVKHPKNIENIQMAVTGGAPLIVNGKIPTKYSFDIPGRHPRTAIGYDHSKTFLYMVTVDGRQNSSIGMTLNELSQLMRSIGCDNALNLDGGGSTSMAIREPKTNIVNIVNSPSNLFPRNISAGIGVFTSSTLIGDVFNF